MTSRSDASNDLPGVDRTIRAGWRRIARAGLLIIVLLAALGLFGGGPWGARTLEGPSGSVRFQRIVHQDADSSLEIRLRGSRQEVRILEIDGEAARRIDFGRIQPHPVRERAIPGGLQLDFQCRADPPGASDCGLSIPYRARRYGWLELVLRLPPDPPLSFRQLVLP
jgi:hypothetical protein